jgi:hypothetical protein
LAVYNLPEAHIAHAKLHQDCHASLIQIKPGGAKVVVQFTTADRGARNFTVSAFNKPMAAEVRH